MKYINISGKSASQIALGCMRISGMNEAEIDNCLNTAIECGINYFDHADIYGGGGSEEVFGAALKRNPALRDKIILQSKCSIRGGMYDFSKDYITESVDGCLKRLGVEKLDVLLLHRPDLLMEPEQVAEAFNILEKQGKVVSFGVSNHSPMQIELLQKYLDQKLIINQMQLSLANAKMLASGAAVNTAFDDAVNRDGYVRDWCRLNNITIQPWSPLQHGFIEGTFIDNPDYPQLNAKLSEMGEKYGITKAAIAIAWLLRLPEKMQPVVGSTNPTHIKEIAKAADVEMEARDWYSLYLAAGYKLP